MAREGNLEAPTRHPLDWKNPDFHDEAKALLKAFGDVEIRHIPREENGQADAMSNRAIDERL